MLWSVTLQATGDRPMTHEEIVELADAVAPAQGIASGIGSEAYGVQLVVHKQFHTLSHAPILPPPNPP